jgi:hypothetical protein
MRGRNGDSKSGGYACRPILILTRVSITKYTIFKLVMSQLEVEAELVSVRIVRRRSVQGQALPLLTLDLQNTF